MGRACNFYGMKVERNRLVYCAVALVVSGGIVLLWLKPNSKPSPDQPQLPTQAELRPATEPATPAIEPQTALAVPTPAEQPTTQVAAAADPTPTKKPLVEHSHLLRSDEIQFDTSLQALAEAYRAADLRRFSMPTFDGDSLNIDIRRVQDHALGGTVLSGSVAGEPHSRVTLAEKDGMISGSIRWPEQNLVYEIRPIAAGEIAIGEVDLDALGDCALCASHAPSTPR